MRWSGRQAVVTLPRQVGLSNASAVAEQLLAVLDCGAAVLIADMTGTRSCDYAGIDALTRVYQRAVAQSAELRLVICVPVVLRVVALSGLGQLVSVFPTLQAAQAAQLPLAVVLPLRPDAVGSASLDGFGQAAQQGTPWYEFDDALGRVTDGIFCAGLTLQAALDEPAGDLRQAAEHTLELLDEMVREARDAALARYRHAAHGMDITANPGAAERGSGGPAKDAGLDALERFEAESLRARCGSTWTRSREVRARARELLVLSAAARSRAAATLGQRAARGPRVIRPAQVIAAKR